MNNTINTLNILETGYEFNAGSSIGGLEFGITYKVINYGVAGGRLVFITFEDETGDIVNIEGKDIKLFLKHHNIHGYR